MQLPFAAVVFWGGQNLPPALTGCFILCCFSGLAVAQRDVVFPVLSACELQCARTMSPAPHRLLLPHTQLPGQVQRHFRVRAVLCPLLGTCDPSSLLWHSAVEELKNPSSVTWCFLYFLAWVYLSGLELAANSSSLAGAHATSSCAAAPAPSACFGGSG